MTAGKIVCSPGKHRVSVDQVVITRCRNGCSFQAVACFEHGGIKFTDKAHADHMRAVNEHGSDKLIEQCLDALQKAHRGLAELIVCGCTSDADMEVEMTALCDAINAVNRWREGEG